MTQHFRQSRQIVESHGGIVPKTLGDGVMALFHSASEAVRAAIALQQTSDRDAKRSAASNALARRRPRR